MSFTEELKQKIYAGADITRDEALALVNVPLEELTAAANEIREKVCENRFDMCTIVNGKCGRCPEDCKYCAQSAHYRTDCQETYPLLSTEELVKGARYNKEQGVLRYSIVTSGRRLSDAEVEQVCGSIREIRRQVDIEICVSFGLLGEAQFRKIKEAGASRVHCNLESSRNYFPQICTTHTYDEKIETLKAAQRAGLSVCSGGIMGLGETMEDRTIESSQTMSFAASLRSFVLSYQMDLSDLPAAGDCWATKVRNVFGAEPTLRYQAICSRQQASQLQQIWRWSRGWDMK